MEINKIKICFVVSSLANEGPVNVMYNIVKYMDSSIYSIKIVTLIPEKENSRFNDFENLGLVIIPVHEKTTSQSFFKRIVAFRKVIKEINPNIVHSHCPRSLIYINFLPKKFKTAYTAHIFPGVQQLALYGKVKGKMIIKLTNFLMKKVDMPIACSESVSLEFYNAFKWKIKAINNGCSLDIWKVNSFEKSEIRTSLKLDQNLEYFLFIGRFSKEKNPIFLIEQFESLTNSNQCLLMLGEGPLFTEINTKKYKNVKLIGFKSEILPYLIASDYYVSASNTEGLANTLLESMAVGLPLLLSDIPSHNSVLSNSKFKLGFLFDNASKNDFKSKMNLLLEMDRENISNNVQKEYAEKYTALTMSNNYSDVYKSMLN
jgi:glycosyltransferase involved in cell wall biosynthesis